MNNLRTYILLAAAAISFAACSDDNDSIKTNSNVAIEVRASISNSSTRAAGTAWATNDQIGISTVTGTATSYSNVPYIYNGSTFSANTSAIYFQSSEEVTFYAYYPYTATNTYSNVSTDATMQTDDNQPTIDFLYASGAKASKSSPTVNFTGDYAFRHRMSRIVIQLNQGNGLDLTQLKGYTLSGLSLTGSFDTTTGVAAATENSTSDLAIELSNVTTTSGVYSTSPVIVFPQSTTSIVLTLSIGDNTYKATLTVPAANDGTGLQAGLSYLFPVTANNTGLTVGTAEIVDWETVTGESVEATMQ